MNNNDQFIARKRIHSIILTQTTNDLGGEIDNPLEKDESSD